LKITTRKAIITVAAVVMVVALLAGCTGQIAASGWAGVTQIDNTLVFTSTSGSIWSLDSDTGSKLGDPVKLTITSPGLLGCGSSTRGNPVYSTPAITGNLVIIPGSGVSRVYAYPLVDGSLVDGESHKDMFKYGGWIYPISNVLSSPIVGGVVVDTGVVYFGTANGTVHALDAVTGEEKAGWPIELGAKIWSAPVVSGNSLYISTLDKKLYALNVPDGTVKWVYETKGAISASPIVHDNLIYFGSYDRDIYAIDTTGKLVWRFPAADDQPDAPRNWFWTAPLIYGDNLFAPCLDGKVYVLNAKNGNFVKSIGMPSQPDDFKGSISASLTLIGDRIMVAATDLSRQTSKAYVIDVSTLTASEKSLQSFNGSVDATLYGNGSYVYIHTTGNKYKESFYRINITDNTKLVWDSANNGKWSNP
jgi:outer membrane protein assembly factor BamB